MNEWKALVGRITAFSATPSQPPSAAILYRAIWESEPDSFQKQENPLLPSIAQGARDGMTASCSVVAGRADFNLTPSRPLGPEVGLSLFEDSNRLSEGLAQITDALGRGAYANGVSRVALYVQFLNPAPGYTEANKLLTKVIPDKYGVRLTTEEDVVFQINCPYASHQANDLVMNSIVKWSLQKLQVVSFTITGLGPFGPANQPTAQAKSYVAASVNFDINSRPTKAPLVSGQVAALLREALATVEQSKRDLGFNDGAK